MAVQAGDLVDVTIEKPASGGRMLARHEGQVVLVAGAIPGERVTARVTKRRKAVAFAEVTAVLDPSNDRREAGGDPACGGCLYAHIDTSAAGPAESGDHSRRVRPHRTHSAPRGVHGRGPGREHGYRMRARFHVLGGRAVVLSREHPRHLRSAADAPIVRRRRGRGRPRHSRP